MDLVAVCLVRELDQKTVTRGMRGPLVEPQDSQTQALIKLRPSSSQTPDSF